MGMGVKRRERIREGERKKGKEREQPWAPHDKHVTVRHSVRPAENSAGRLGRIVYHIFRPPTRPPNWTEQILTSEISYL